MAEASAQETRADASSQLVQYETHDGVALLTLNDPPANTYSYEMMQALDGAILGANGRAGASHRHHRTGREIFLRGRKHSNALKRHAGVQILFLFARERNAVAFGADAETRHRGN